MCRIIYCDTNHVVFNAKDFEVYFDQIEQRFLSNFIESLIELPVVKTNRLAVLYLRSLSRYVFSLINEPKFIKSFITFYFIFIRFCKILEDRNEFTIAVQLKYCKDFINESKHFRFDDDYKHAFCTSILRKSAESISVLISDSVKHNYETNIANLGTAICYKFRQLLGLEMRLTDTLTANYPIASHVEKLNKYLNDQNPITVSFNSNRISLQGTFQLFIGNHCKSTLIITKSTGRNSASKS